MTDHPAIVPQSNSSMSGIGPNVVIIGGDLPRDFSSICD
jgi:hypothetical protein